MSLFRKTLTEAKLPTPSSIMTDLICLKIAAMPADNKWGTQRDMFLLSMPIQGGEREIEIRAIFCLHSGRARCTNRVEKITVGLPGEPAYRSVDLSPEEHDKIKLQIEALIKRSQAAIALRREATSQSAALDIIEGLIS